MAQVRVTEGILEGELTQNEFGSPFYSFRGIPYAQPPVGQLRFKAPQPAVPWEGVRQAKEFGSKCFQYDFFPIGEHPSGDEDCLYLNVYTPDLKPSKPLPVMFWIHGGAFLGGSGNDDMYGPEFLVRHGVIVVTINYRLGALGFLCLDSEDIPGNAGMKDQVAALRWVNKNIKQFGGDSGNVTIFGESAGSASVAFQLVSPMSKGIFKRAILQSGTLLCPWAKMFEPREMALKLAKQLGCNSEDDKELHDFFIGVPVEQLILLKLPVIYSTQPSELYFGIADERKFGNKERFFYGDVSERLRESIHEDVDVIIGYNQDEGIIGFVGKTLEKVLAEVNGFKEYLVPIPIKLNNIIKVQLEIGRKIKEFYFGRGIITEDNKEQLLKFIDWDMFLQGSMLMAQLICQKRKVYLYKFTCKSERNIMAQIFGVGDFIKGKQLVSHADDLLYLFPTKIPHLLIDQKSESYQMINRFTKLWTNFAKFGNPTPDNSLDVQWAPFTLIKRDYLEIGNTLMAGTSPDEKDLIFWNSIYREYLPSWVPQ